MRKSCYHRIKCITAIVLAAFMWRRPLNRVERDLYPQKIKSGKEVSGNSSAMLDDRQVDDGIEQ